MAGLHPCSVNDNYLDELSHVEKVLENHPIVAIGEIGIDLYWDKSTLSIQKKAFASQIRLAKDLNLPIVIHCRDAFEEIFEILDLENCDKLRGVFHCFTGTLEQAKRAIDLGFLLGIGGVVTFKNGGIDKFLNKIDLKYIVLETDSPYLIPRNLDPKPKSNRNEPKNLFHIATEIAKLRNESVDEICNATYQNSINFFSQA